ncbi:ribonuclease HI [Desulfobacterium sp. N47]|uniref:ribonuclease H n=1 Tax=uncultured Desulfobacterium sp. TaxID=201089 RepID=E1YD78_9BACT|nr:Ribonuclease H [uncultured Desulfobacterium sp.]
MDTSNILWKRMAFKGNKVWQAFSSDEKPLVKNGKVLIKYNIKQDYEYWVFENKLEPVDSINSDTQEDKKVKDRKSFAGKKSANDSSRQEDIPSDAICIYTDGASSGNPGPSGIGVYFRFGEHEKEISRYIGIATNNIAELEAIKTALTELKTTKKPVRIFTDSSYSYGVLTLNWKPKKNIELINSIKVKMKNFYDIKLIKVKGHAGYKENELADFLATRAVKNGSKT